MSKDNSAHTEGSDDHRVFGMTQYPPPQHIVPGGPEFGYFQSDDLWTEEQVAMWRKNWFSDARPEPEEVDLHKTLTKHFWKFFHESGNIADAISDDELSDYFDEVVNIVKSQNGIQHRILNNGDKLI